MLVYIILPVNVKVLQEQEASMWMHWSEGNNETIHFVFSLSLPQCLGKTL